MLSGNRRTPPHVELICTGTELLTGKINTHTAYVGEKLASIGLTLAADHTVGDDAVMMEKIFTAAFKRSDVIFSAGGLGPTFDDLTREVWARVIKRPLEFQKALLSDIRDKFKQRGIFMPPENRRQAYVLKGAQVLTNDYGTAPGQWIEINGKIVILLPGPARELMPMLENDVFPRLTGLFPDFHTALRKFHMVGVPESVIDQRVRPLVKRFTRLEGCVITHGILASQSIITVKFRVDGPTPVAVSEVATFLEKKFRRVLGSDLFGEEGQSLESVIGAELKQRELTVAVAESCTGGLIAKMLTDQPGASAYFKEGMVTYTNDSKMKRLGVHKETLQKNGAVSKQTASEMARGLRFRAGVTYALSVTGIAGPDGATPQKPVGLVYIGCAGPKRTIVKEFKFQGERKWIRHRAALMALELLRKELHGR